VKNVSEIAVESFGFDITRDFAITPRKIKSGIPERVDGMTVGIVTMEHSAPHGGEVHPDGDELLYVISGRVQVTCDSAPGDALVLEAGRGCIVARGEWHKVEVLEKTQLLHITPGPNGDHRPL
jgi:mannose-6-phosphate isomerase-like protein (cupin superfamily)